MILKFGIQALRLYAITADGMARDPGGWKKVRAWLEAGVRAVQLRDKNLPREDVLGFGIDLRAITSELGALLIVNDDPHLARLLDADGCHLGREDMPVAEARRILGEEKIIGLSTHNREQVVAGAESGADYIGVGPIFASRTKEAGRAPLGPDFAGWAARESPLPVVAIGGITTENAGQIARAGCMNVAVVSALNDAREPAETVRAFLRALAPTASAAAR